MKKLKIIGHRGARGLAQENTIEGFKVAIELKVDRIEFDVRVNQRGIPVLLHNYEWLSRGNRPVETLDAALKFIDGQTPLYVEVKNNDRVEPIVKILKKYKGDFWLGSKSQKTLLELHKAMPEVPKIVIEQWSGILASRHAKQVDTKLLAMNQRWLWSGFIAAVNRSGYQLYAYPLNDPVKAKRWAKHGLTGVITDYPNRFNKPGFSSGK